MIGKIATVYGRSVVTDWENPIFAVALASDFIQTGRKNRWGSEVAPADR
jgi:hypothetical protein